MKKILKILFAVVVYLHSIDNNNLLNKFKTTMQYNISIIVGNAKLQKIFFRYKMTLKLNVMECSHSSLHTYRKSKGKHYEQKSKVVKAGLSSKWNLNHRLCASTVNISCYLWYLRNGTIFTWKKLGNIENNVKFKKL